MNNKLLLPFLLASTLSGCVVANYQDGYYGDVTFTWTFGGLQCSGVPQVASVQITIPGEILQNDGNYPCSTNGYSGITLTDFAPGPYDFTIQGLSYSRTVLYTASGTFRVDGNVQVSIDLAPAGGANSYAYLMWSFPPNSISQNPTCDQAGATFVDVSIDQAPSQRFNCSAGMVAPGVQTPFLTPGTHQIQLLGVDNTGYPYYRFVGTLTTYTGTPTAASYQLGWSVGGVSIAWQLIDGFSQTCAQAGVQAVSVNFRDSSGNLVYGANGDSQLCGNAPIFYNALQPGSYQVFLQATGSAGLYRSDNQNPPVVTIVAGRFVDESSTPLTVPMYRQ